MAKLPSDIESVLSLFVATSSLPVLHFSDTLPQAGLVFLVTKPEDELRERASLLWCECLTDLQIT